MKLKRSQFGSINASDIYMASLRVAPIGKTTYSLSVLKDRKKVLLPDWRSQYLSFNRSLHVKIGRITDKSNYIDGHSLNQQ